MSQIINKREIEDLIPHSGLMCLNDEAIEWDSESAICKTRSHLNKNNPLMRNGQLSGLHAIEYCAQVMAIHGGLLAKEKGQKLAPGFLAAVRNTRLEVEYLNSVNHTLYIKVSKVMAQGGSLVYQFVMYYIDAECQHNIASGRATVIEMS